MQTISNSSTWAKLLYEFIGTAILVFEFNSVPYGYGREIPLAYFIMFILAYKISGAHFNPALSLVVFIHERSVKNLLGLGLTILCQFAGAYLGVALSYLLVKDYFLNYRLKPDGGPGTLYLSPTGDVYWARLILQEII